MHANYVIFTTEQPKYTVGGENNYNFSWINILSLSVGFVSRKGTCVNILLYFGAKTHWFTVRERRYGSTSNHID